MNKKKFILIMIYLATISCGFTPVAFYKEDLSINIRGLDYRR